MAKTRKIGGLRWDGSFAEAAVRVVGVRAQELFEHSEGVLDTRDIERLHDMRVATRRLRAVLEIFAPCFECRRHRGLLADVKELADALGERRDPDVQLEALGSYAAFVPPAERPGVEVMIERTRERQARGNRAVEDALERIGLDRLRGRVEALLETAG